MLLRKTEIQEMKDLLTKIGHLKLTLNENGYLVNKQEIVDKLYYRIQVKIGEKRLEEFSETELNQMLYDIDECLSCIEGNRKNFLIEMKEMVNTNLKKKTLDKIENIKRNNKMEKRHVYQIDSYIDIDTLKNVIYPLIEPSKSIDTVSQSLVDYLKIDGSSLKHSEVTIQVLDQKKDLKSYLEAFYVSLGVNDEWIIQKLDKVGIKEKNIDIKEFLNLLNKVINQEELLEEMNGLEDYTNNNISVLLEKYGISLNENNITNFVAFLKRLSFNHLVENQCNFQPIQRMKYYNEQNDVICKIKMEKNNRLFTTLTEFDGEIYESLNFKDDEEAKKYQEENNIEEDLSEDVVSVLHFHSESILNDWYNKLTILKYRKGCMYINYGERLFVLNKVNNCSITAEEVEALIKEFEYRDIDNEFIKYVVHELKQFQKSLIEKKDRKKLKTTLTNSRETTELYNMIHKRENSLEESKKILNDENYGTDKTIYLKIKVVSDTPITFEKNTQLVLK